MKFRSAFLACSMLVGFSASVVTNTAEAQTCTEVSEERELLIRDLGVVEDPVRTTGSGVWSFKHLMEAMAPSAAAAPAMVEDMFSTWLSDQTINGFTVPARPAMQELVLSSWPRVDGALDLAAAPVRLLAIVNRLDLRDLSRGQAGEGRFVFGITDSSGQATPFTLILEYRLPASSEAEVLEWANLWHGLNGLAPGSAEYNAALEVITERFAGDNADPARVNGSALNQIRTNEIALAFPWELREFTLGGSSFTPATVKLTPDSTFIDQEIVAQFINENEGSILIERHDVPNTFQGQPFLAGSSINTLAPWTAPGINDNEARHKFSLNTCNGCHGRETNTMQFLHIFPRAAGEVAQISGFMSGVQVDDPVDGTLRTFDDLDRRATDMERLLCSTSGLVRRSNDNIISLGIERVH